MAEKSGSLRLPMAERRERAPMSLVRIIGIAATAVVMLCTLFYSPAVTKHGGLSRPMACAKGQCAQENPMAPPADDDLDEKLASFDTPAYRNFTVSRFSKAIQIPTENYDDMKLVGEEPRFEIFTEFHDYLAEAFPKIHKHCELTKVNTYGLLYECVGTNSSLKPFVMMAHQDVVPVPRQTWDRWTHDPFSGYFDGDRVWGRGASDDKGPLMAVMSAVEGLLEAKFKPQRTLILSFGFDEETSGYQGAAFLSRHILDKYGSDSVEAIIDEGATLAEFYGQEMAIPVMREKGYMDVSITINTPGGHSSIPPDHTGIGIMAQLIEWIEDHPYSPELSSANPFLETLRCVIAHSPKAPKGLGALLPSGDGKLGKIGMAALLAAAPQLRYEMQTSIAVDIIHGGVKINALPEQVTAVVNHRVDVHSNSSDVKDVHVVGASKVAKDNDLGLIAFGATVLPPTDHGYIMLNTSRILEPSPYSPTDSPQFKALSGLLRNEYPGVVVAPSIITGNTDTKYYWELSRDIWRFTPFPPGAFSNFHTVDESLQADGFIKGIKVYYQLIRLLDATKFE